MRQSKPTRRKRTTSFVSIRGLGIAFAIFMLTATASYADPITFFGEDQGPLINTSSRPNTETARADFLAKLNTSGTEDFESFSAGFHNSLNLDFSGTFAGTLTPEKNQSFVADSSALATSGNRILNFIESINDSFTITLAPNDRVNSLGFYGIDVGDLGGKLTLTLQNGTSEVIDLVVPHTVPSALQTYFYFGVIIPDKIITSARYDNVGGGVSAGFDAFLFDDITVGKSTYTVPEGGSATGFLGLGLVLLGLCAAVRSGKEWEWH